MSDDYGLMENYDEGVYCPHCEQDMDWVDCDACGGEGMGDHDCGEDCCACLDPEPNTICDQCAGAGGWYWCSNSRCAGKRT